MKLSFTLFITLYCYCFCFSQKNFHNHTVVKGDNLTEISRKYNVSIKEIKEANPNLSAVLQLKSIVKIPRTSESNKVTSSKKQVHDVQSKETLYGISKKYKVSIENIKKANIELEKQALAMGMKLNIPEDASIETQEISSNEPKKKLAVFNPENTLQTENIIYKTVLPQETKYGISKQYGISIIELEKQNPDIVNGLPIGYRLKITTPTNQIVAEEKNEINIPEEKKIETAETEKIETKPEININSEESVGVAKPIENIELAEQLVAKASDNLGVQYRTGGTSKSGFDCSGLMVATFGSFDIKLPRTSRDQSNFGYRVSKNDAQKGDLIFFSTNGSGNVNHVGMVVENVDGEIKFIHSSTHKGVIYSSASEGYYARTFIKINRVLTQITH
jgi:peptidoglycan DL-endopeptidase LytE